MQGFLVTDWSWIINNPVGWKSCVEDSWKRSSCLAICGGSGLESSGGLKNCGERGSCAQNSVDSRLMWNGNIASLKGS